MIEVVDALPPADRRSAFANAPMGVALTTPAGVLRRRQPRALRACSGRTAEELYGRSVLDLVHPDGVGGRRGGARLAGRRSRDRPMRHETRLVRADGSEVPVQVTASWVRRDARTARPPTW